MLSVLDNPAIRARVPALSVENYHRMFEMGMLSPKVELIRSAIIEQEQKTPLHSFIVGLLHDQLLHQRPANSYTRSKQPLTFSDSEPEPDLAVVRGTARDYFTAHPDSAELVIEVAVSSEALDRLKFELYAEAGVRECWLVLAEERIVERHIEPQGAAYQRIERTAFPEALESTVLPGLLLPPAGLFPA